MVSDKKKKAFLLILNRWSKKRRSKRKYWIHPMLQNRDVDGESVKIDRMREYPDRFANYTRMSPEVFETLFSIVGSSLVKLDTNWRNSLPPRLRLYVLVRFLATGDDLRTIATSFSIGYSTTWDIIHEGLPIIWNALKDKYLKEPSKADWTRIVEGFYDKWNFPNCVGAIDGKHVVIQAPPKTGSLYHNYKGTFSIVLLATCDADYMFTTVSVGSYGKQSDGGIYSGSTLGKKMADGTLDMPENRCLPNSTINLPCFFVGDEAFPLSTRMMRPFPGQNLSEAHRIFNYRLSRARRCIENAFGILAARWRVFRKPIIAEPKHAEHIVLAAVALHNFVMTEEAGSEGIAFYNPPGIGDDPTDTVNDLNGGWRHQDVPSALGSITTRHQSAAAQERVSKKMRDDICTYLLNEGAVDWQYMKING